MHKNTKLEVFPTPQALAESALAFIQKLAEKAKKEDRVFRLAISGGSTPRRLFSLVEEKAKQNCFILSDAEIFMVDERWVPSGHADHNASMAWGYFKNSNIPKTHFYPMPTDGKSPQEDAEAYAQLLKEKYGKTVLASQKPLFDLVLLGLGTDGHTASLFPGNAILQEKTAWVATSQPLDAPHQRISLTYPVIENAENVLFLVEGASKKEMLAKLLKGDGDIPAGRLAAEKQVFVMADSPAANR